jgi:hypothetical protein
MIRGLLATAIFITATSVVAQPSCSANLAVKPSRATSSRNQLILEAYINGAGPYAFLLDTGSQITMIDEALAAELKIQPTTTQAAVVGVSLQGKGGKYALVDSVRVGETARVGRLYVLTFNMNDIHTAGYSVRGLIGEDFLSHFDATIDNTHNRICLTEISN